MFIAKKYFEDDYKVLTLIVSFKGKGLNFL
jgi:hypothetical protein